MADEQTKPGQDTKDIVWVEQISEKGKTYKVGYPNVESVPKETAPATTDDDEDRPPGDAEVHYTNSHTVNWQAPPHSQTSGLTHTLSGDEKAACGNIASYFIRGEDYIFNPPNWSFHMDCDSGKGRKFRFTDGTGDRYEITIIATWWDHVFSYATDNATIVKVEWMD